MSSNQPNKSNTQQKGNNNNKPKLASGKPKQRYTPMPQSPVTCSVPGHLKFHDALDHFNGLFSNYLKEMGPIIAKKRENAPYIIERGRGIAKDYIMGFRFTNDKNNSVAHTEHFDEEDDNGEVVRRAKHRHINMARFLTNPEFQDAIADHYWDTHRMNIEFFQTDFDRKTKRYTKACIKFCY
jgi:hypothetical protein